MENEWVDVVWRDCVIGDVVSLGFLGVPSPCVVISESEAVAVGGGVSVGVSDPNQKCKRLHPNSPNWKHVFQTLRARIVDTSEKTRQALEAHTEASALVALVVNTRADREAQQ